MATVITMPQLGETLTEGTIGKWLKKEGDFVQRDEPLVEVLTDKVNTEIPSPVAGIVQKIAVPQGVTVPVGTEIAIVQPQSAEVSPTEEVIAPVQRAELAAPIQQEAPTHYSPVVKRLAEEYKIDLSQVKGTGLGGRVTKEDVLAFVAQKGGVTEKQPAQVPPSQVVTKEESIIPITALRRQIADHMVKSKDAIPRAWTVVEIDVTNLVKLREGIKEEFRRQEGANITYVPFVIKAVVGALREFPLLNSVWGGDRIILNKEINIGVAVDTEQGLIVPVIHKADAKSIADLAKEVDALAQKAREGKLALADVQGGTFTINNPGAFGSIISLPLVNYPQVAIMNMEAIVKRPVVVNDAIAIRSMMNLGVAFDHKILDGAIVGRFLQSVKGVLESFSTSTALY